MKGNTVKATFILGAADPEMEVIESLLKGGGVAYCYATKDGRRVHPGNAYAADGVSAPINDGHEIVTVECSVAGIAPVTVIDHHRPGDVGYGRPPEEFLPASSLGQTMAWLAINYCLPPFPPCGRTGGGFPGGFVYWQDRNAWSISDWDVGAEIPRDLTLAAAADHCLGAAYAGRCPGVSNSDLRAWRATQKAAFQQRSVEEVVAEIKDTARVLATLAEAQAKENPDYVSAVREFERTGGFRPNWRVYCGVVDLGATTLPELPEAAAWEQIAYVATVTERDGRRKRVIGGATTPAIVRAWMEGEGATLVGTYGDPERGFAGGYLP